MGRARRMNSAHHLVEILEPRCLFSAAPMGLLHGHAAKVQNALHFGKRAVQGASIVGQLAAATEVTVSTVPSNGDLNPYGVAFVPQGFPRGGPLNAGDLLVSNFNASSNNQGTGTTIVRVTPNGRMSTFFQGPPGLGLTTALSVLKNGFVVVGSLPTTDGTSATVQQGSLIILDKFGLQVANLSNAVVLNGPWDMTVNEEGSHAQLFVSDVLSGTVTRIDLHFTGQDSIAITDVVQIGSGYAHRTDPAALVLGPTGLAFDSKTGTLYVASTADNAVYSIAHADRTGADGGKGTLIYSDAAHLHGPLGLVLAPNGDLIAANGDGVNADPAQSSELTEFTPTGTFVGQFQLDPNPNDAFGITVSSDSGHVRFAAVHDDHNTVTIWTLGLANGH